MRISVSFFFFFFNDTATTEIYTLSLHDALPIFHQLVEAEDHQPAGVAAQDPLQAVAQHGDRKSTRLNSSHQIISYAVFCLKKKKERRSTTQLQQTLGLAYKRLYLVVIERPVETV